MDNSVLWRDCYSGEALSQERLKFRNRDLMTWLPKLKKLTILALRSVDLVGEIPSSLADIKVIDFSSDKFPGKIRAAVGNLRGLEALNNTLSGGIPHELSELTYLEVFNVSYNNLVAPIPEGGQFSTFDSSSVDRNSGLCGFIVGKLHITDKYHAWFTETFGRMKVFPASCNLGMIDLSENQLQGRLPKSLSNCNNLAVFVIGQNHIDDAFPHGLDLFQNYIYLFFEKTISRARYN
ncbi:hypothetical protein Cgig2_004039 [Carnegiea gigantea]|uniref:Uncharacterized protein n=1 Tax=Carnegiea gigantea TaxID=171969 RepID=A0A9Q1KSN4_9CARY|nr:hypothetical protein Cgig2_004039 [Carnegiea gigantea]